MVSSTRHRGGVYWGVLTLVLGSCAELKPPAAPLSNGHLTQPAAPAPAAVTPSDIPPVVPHSAYVPPPQPMPEGERYTVVVNDVPVRELLFALARDAKRNVDIAGDVSGTITLNAIEQTLPQILDRVAREVKLRYRLEGANIVIEADSPFFRNYEVGYVNLSRDTDTTVSVATQVATTGEGATGNVGGGGGGNRGGGGGGGTNSSSTRVNSKSSNRFWETLTANILAILGDKPSGNKEQLTSNNLVVNAEAGVISVKATTAQHQQIQEFIDRVLTNARRQVLIEATIVEVTLNDQYQSGVDWKIVLDASRAGFHFNQNLLGPINNGVVENAISSFVFGYTDPGANGRLVDTTVRLLREFGDTKVLSSPRLMVINNQTALLKVVDELVYFTIDVTTTDSTLNAQGRSFVSTQVHSVPVGLVMAVTPQISVNQEVTLTVRPTISQKIGDAIDPGPQLAAEFSGKAANSITNTVPVIRTREMESVLKLVNGQIGVLGGLMQDEIKNGNREVPGLSKLPFIGDMLFHARDGNNKKTELVVFLRPVIVAEPSVETDLKSYGQFLGGDPATKAAR